jgi:DNA polymerase (family 10)
VSSASDRRRNEFAAAAFDEIAVRLLLQGESWFKVRAYREGAQALREATESVDELLAAGRLASLPHVGKAIAEKTEALLTTGVIPLLERLRAELPAGLVELVNAGLPPATVRRLHAEFGVDGPAALAAALAAGKLDGDKKLRAAAEAALARDIKS